MSIKLSKEIHDVVKKLVEAEVAKSWQGSKDPSEHAFIDLALMSARAEFERVLLKVRTRR